MAREDFVDDGLDSYNLRVMAVVLAVLAALCWFLLMILGGGVPVLLAALAVGATVASAAYAVCSAVKGAERRLRAQLRTERTD